MSVETNHNARSTRQSSCLSPISFLWPLSVASQSFCSPLSVVISSVVTKSHQHVWWKRVRLPTPMPLSTLTMPSNMCSDRSMWLRGIWGINWDLTCRSEWGLSHTSNRNTLPQYCVELFGRFNTSHHKTCTRIWTLTVWKGRVASGIHSPLREEVHAHTHLSRSSPPASLVTSGLAVSSLEENSSSVLQIRLFFKHINYVHSL